MTFRTFLYSSIVLIASCNSETKFEKEIAEIEQMHSMVVQETHNLDELDSAKMMQMRLDYERTVHAFKTYYDTDTVDQELGRQMNLYKGLKSILDADGKFLTLKRESMAILSQLDDLKHDLEHNLISEDSAKQFVDTELSVSNKHLELMREFRIFIQDIEANYDTLNPKISVIVDSLMYINENSTE